MHDLYGDEEVKAALQERFGTSDREAVSKQVVADREALLWLEALLHPRVLARTEAWREELASLPDPPALAVNEVPLLYEAGAESRFDAVVVITAPRELRVQRAGERVDEREERLLPDEAKIERADFAYVNDGSLDELDAFVAGVVRTPDRPMRRLVASTLLIVAIAGSFIYLRSGEPAWFQRLRYPLRYEQIVRGHARNYRLDPALLAAVIYQESKFRADAKSSSGAIGLMQLRPDTAKGIAIRTGGSRFQTSDLYNPEINVRYGSWYLRHLLDKYGDEKLALAAYNAGQHNVDTWRAEGKGIQFSETRAYVDRVEKLKEIYRRAYKL